MNIHLALVIDFLLLAGSLFIILQVSDASIFNPSYWYLALHAYTVTFRLVTLNLGGVSLAVIGIQSDTELVNAALASDMSLMATVVATLVIAQRIRCQGFQGHWSVSEVQLSSRVGWVISIFCFTIGTYALLKFGTAATAIGRARGADISTIDVGRFDESAYPIWVSGFAVQGALIQCALRGFTRWRVVLLVVLLAASAFNARTAFVLAFAMAYLIYQTRRTQHSVSGKWVVGMILLGVVWFVFKPVAGAIIAGETPQEIWSAATSYLVDAFNNDSSIDTQFLDMQATYMAAADEAGRRYYGATILPLLYLPIPRFVWPDKPPLNAHGAELSSSSRMMSQVGMTPNLSGESYLNFGWPGCFFIPFLYVLCMQMAYRRVAADGITSATRWVYLIYLVSTVQVFRDGLDSLVLYPLMAYLPLLSWGVISRLLPAGRVRVSRANSLNAAGRGSGSTG